MYSSYSIKHSNVILYIAYAHVQFMVYCTGITPTAELVIYLIASFSFAF